MANARSWRKDVVFLLVASPPALILYFSSHLHAIICRTSSVSQPDDSIIRSRGIKLASSIACVVFM